MFPNSSFHRTAFLSLAVAALSSACRESTAADVVPTEVVVTGVDTLRSIGATATLTAAVRNAHQQAIPGVAVSNWESSDPAVVTVNAATGLATAVANGTATITARAGTLTGSANVTVRQRIDRTKSTISVVRSLLFVDDIVRVTLNARDALDNPLTFGGAAVVFSTSGGTSTGTLGPTVDRGDGTYTSDFVGRGIGTALTIGATIDGTAVPATAPTLRVVGFTKIGAYSSGFTLTCGIITTSDLYCWGEPNGVARGTGVLSATGPAPTLVAGGHRWTDVEVGAAGVCGIVENTRLYCWGDASQGSLGNGATSGPYPLPVAVLPESSFVSLDLGLSNGDCAITTGHTAMCWSSGTWGRLGNGADTMVAVPVRVSGGHKFAGIGTSFSGSCGVTDAGAAMCWGHSSGLGIGSGPFPDTCAGSVSCAKTPVAASGGITFKPIIFHGGNEVCAIATNDKTYCWGLWDQVPTELFGAPVFTSLATGDMDNCGVAQSGTAYCWGTNRNGRFGSPPDINQIHRVPEPVPGGQRFTQLSMGQNHMCGVATDGNAWCWGSNGKGELGDGTTTASAVPVRVKLFAP
jgi:hypothetical protein